ncbi:MAG TPA: sterol carrier protein domain-containing protein, partial [Mycobacteriales bacterium]|nr:sterol carrier protein domain-containing protein [Mycobacteriales bacterium]
LAGVSGAVTVRLVDPLLPPNDGAFRLTVDDGCGTLESVPDDHDRAPTLHIRGWSQLWCGTASASQLRLCGLLAGGEPADDEVLDRLFAAPGVAALLDYF